MPTPARITLMMEVMSDVQFTLQFTPAGIPPGRTRWQLDCALRLSRCGYGYAFRVCDLRRSLGRSSGRWRVGLGALHLILSHR